MRGVRPEYPCPDGDDDSKVLVACINETLIHWVSWLTKSMSRIFELKIGRESQELLITWSGK